MKRGTLQIKQSFPLSPFKPFQTVSDYVTWASELQLLQYQPVVIKRLSHHECVLDIKCYLFSRRRNN